MSKLNKETVDQLKVLDFYYMKEHSDIEINHQLKCVMIRYEYSRWMRYINDKHKA